MRAARGLYAIVDPSTTPDPERLADAILRGGCACLQLRCKRENDAELLSLARALAARCRRAGVPFIVNDRADIAAIVGADGLHLGQTDLPIAEARRIVGSISIGCSTHDESQARAAVHAGADVIAFGPIFETQNKTSPDPVVGLERLGALCRVLPLPVVAIGGITVQRAHSIAGCGARWAAVIGALADAKDPESTARELHRALGADR
jgi:thiamine-phosphate pyrophosphorylase